MINNHDPGMALVGWPFKSTWAMAIHLENRQIMADSLMMFMTHLRGPVMGLLHKLLTKSKIVREDVLHVASCQDSTLNISKRDAVTSHIDSPSGFFILPSSSSSLYVWNLLLPGNRQYIR